jgi:hypothetical protein
MSTKVWFVVFGMVFVLFQCIKAADGVQDQPPHPPTISNTDNQIPPLGGQANENRLKQVIKETIKPKLVEHKALPADLEALLTWSKPVRGLVARIESVWAGEVFFVRLKNMSDQPLSVPTGNPGNEKAAPLFEIYMQQGLSPWRRAAKNYIYNRYFSTPFDPDADIHTAHPSRFRERQSDDRPWVTLQPGEDCIALVAGLDEKDSGEPKTAKVILRQPDSSLAGCWSSSLETPPHPMELSLEQHRAFRGVLPFPNHFPQLSYDYSGILNQSPIASTVEKLHHPNRPLIDLLKLYESDRVYKEFERRMRAEKVMPMKLLLASIAAPAGSEEAALFFLETMNDTSYIKVVNLHSALWNAFWNYLAAPPDWQKEESPDWLLELYLTILCDNRLVTGLDKSRWQQGTSLKISSCETDKLIFALGEAKYRKAVPLLIERMNKRQGDWYTLHALGEIGDARAIPTLIEFLQQTGKRLNYTEESRFAGNWETNAFRAASYALGKLKAKDAVPLLLKYIEYPEIIDDLERIGDPAVLSALREIVAAKGRIIRDGDPMTPKLDRERLYAAKVAIAHFDSINEIHLLGEMLADPTLERDHRYDVVLRMAMRHDPQTIPYLVKVIKTDLDHYIVHMAIRALSELKYKAAVEGLMECFDVNFKEEDLGTGEHVTPEIYRNLIAHSLQQITGQRFGAGKQQWIQWWKEEGSKSTELKRWP